MQCFTFSPIKMGTEVIPKSEEAVPAEAPSEIELKIIQQIEVCNLFSVLLYIMIF